MTLLCLHSKYSIEDGIITHEELCNWAIKNNVKHIAVADRGNMFGAVRLQKIAEANNLIPIFGFDFLLGSKDSHEWATVYIKDEVGYQNANAILTEAYLNNSLISKEDLTPIISLETLVEHQKGLVFLLGGKDSKIGDLLLKGQYFETVKYTRELTKLFGNNFYIKLSTVNEEENELSLRYANLYKATDLPEPIATCYPRFVNKEDKTVHDVRVCNQNGLTLNEYKSEYTEHQYLQTPDELKENFVFFPKAVKNIDNLINSCDFKLNLSENRLPDFEVPREFSLDTFLDKKSYDGLNQHMKNGRIEVCYEDAKKRLDYELGIIKRMGFPGYFLIVADFIQWSKENDVPVGPGRGSGAGSLVAFCLGITDIDPLKYGLLFERFLNPERVSMPDFDVDFCKDGRGKVLDYVGEKYGEEKVSQISTFGTLATRSALKAAQRVLNIPLIKIEALNKEIPEQGTSLRESYETSSEFRRLIKQDQQIHEVYEYALRLEGLPTSVGVHAAGVVIAPTDMNEFTPLYRTKKAITSQYDKDDVESAGLVKFDFLGLRTLTVMHQTMGFIKKNYGEESVPDLSLLSFDDKKTFSLLQSGFTSGVFQLESPGMQKLLRALAPDCFEDLIALVALFRPGPLQSGLVDNFVDCKHGRVPITYPDDSLEEVLKETYGMILYQEQAMKITQVMAGYTLGQADILRKAMGKKIAELMAKQKASFIEGSVKNNYSQKNADYVFDLIDKFSGYGFNKSHAAAYAMITYQTAWLKSHYPVEFLAASLSSKPGDFVHVNIMIEEARQMNIELLPPDVNYSETLFTANKEGNIRFGMTAIKGVKERSTCEIVAARKGRKYSDIFDFCCRVNLQKVSKGIILKLIKVGAFDSIGPNRATLINSLEDAFNSAKQFKKDMNRAKNTKSLTIIANLALLESDPYKNFMLDESDFIELANAEMDLLGIYLTKHPITTVSGGIRRLANGTLDSLIRSCIKDEMEILKVASRGVAKRRATIIAVITRKFDEVDKQGNDRWALIVDDGTRSMRVTINKRGIDRSNQLFKENSDSSSDISIKEGDVVVINGNLSLYRESLKVSMYGDFIIDVEQVNLENTQSEIDVMNARPIYKTNKVDFDIKFNKDKRLLKESTENDLAMKVFEEEESIDDIKAEMFEVLSNVGKNNINTSEMEN